MAIFLGRRWKLTTRFKSKQLAPDDAYLSYYDIRRKLPQMRWHDGLELMIPAVTKEDVDTLKNDWLTDNASSLTLQLRVHLIRATNSSRYLEREELRKYPSSHIVLLRPSMAFMLMQTANPLTLKDALPNFSKTTHIFLPINDARNVSVAEGGSHWSLLLVSVIDGVAFHYDSLSPSNYNEAMLATTRLSQLLGRSLRFMNLDDSPQQENGSDCGVYVRCKDGTAEHLDFERPSFGGNSGLPVLAACVLAGASYPAIPTDLTTPVQQRIAINGPNVSTNSSVEHFFSARSPGDKSSFAMSVVIDLGVYGADGYTIQSDLSKRDTIPSIDPSLNHTTIGRLATNIDNYELVLHPGDFAYADDWYLKPKNLFDGVNAYEAILEQFYDQLAPIAGRKPYMASPGNHEADCEEIDYTTFLCPEGQKNFTDFMNRFGQTMPTAFASTSSNTTAKVFANKAQQLANPPFWYSFEYGMVHVVMLDTETDFTNAPDGPGGSAGLDSGPFGAPNQQLEFLEADLASVDRTVTPWLIVVATAPGTRLAPTAAASAKQPSNLCSTNTASISLSSDTCTILNASCPSTMASLTPME
ncbi:hypothetical protein G7Y89_g6407 [Cudoniella acicularis]|uniref:Ubiquitin-like protease family profile domain-containing protein n=1 Tax=Cudoniella acicularis TaxID=354080 RepID=A0A8H4RMQ9_9HELO|nr:hypothetical protein G7Y89_g6407 [Cudoniella acicularis]